MCLFCLVALIQQDFSLNIAEVFPTVMKRNGRLSLMDVWVEKHASAFLKNKFLQGIYLKLFKLATGRGEQLKYTNYPTKELKDWWNKQLFYWSSWAPLAWTSDWSPAITRSTGCACVNPTVMLLVCGNRDISCLLSHPRVPQWPFYQQWTKERSHPAAHCGGKNFFKWQF